MSHSDFSTHFRPPPRAERLCLLRARFAQLYGAGATRIWRAPARINILGEHIDYVSYLPTASLPFGSHEHEMLLLYRTNDSGLVRGAADDERFPPFQFSLQAEAPTAAADWEEYLYRRPLPMPHWSNYVKGAVLFAVQKHGLGNARGFDFLVSSTIPPQGGSSSSSALVVLAGAAFRQANELAFTHAELAADSAQAEWYVGTRGGALDHTAICLSAPHHVVHLTYENQQTTRLPLPDAGYRWVTFFSHSADKGHAVMLAYNERAAVARLVIPALLARHAKREDIPALLPETMALTDLQQQFPDQFMRCQTAFPALVQERGAQPLKLRERARHHVGEIRRVEAAVELLRQSRDRHTTMQQLGTLLDASHASLRDLYEVSTPRVNQLYEILRAAPNVLGARLIGGGFGGNVLALTPQENVADLIARVQQEYYAPQQRDGVAEGAIMVSTPGAGLSEL